MKVLYIIVFINWRDKLQSYKRNSIYMGLIRFLFLALQLKLFTSIYDPYFIMFVFNELFTIFYQEFCNLVYLQAFL